MNPKIIVAINYPLGRYRAEDLGIYHPTRQDKCMIICTDDPMTVHKLRGRLFTLDDVIWVDNWHGGKYAKRIENEIHIRHWQTVSRKI